MERTFTATSQGPVRLWLDSGNATCRVDPTAKYATIRLHAYDTEKDAIKAINRATAESSRGLSVSVPKLPGRTMVISNGSRGGITVMDSGNVVIGNGVSITGGGSVSAEITVPPGSTLQLQTTSADLIVTGPLATLTVHSVSGDVTTETVGELTVKTVSGSVEAMGVSDQLMVNSTSGDVEIGTYSGTYADLRSVSGDVRLAATPRASGSLTVNTVSGDIKLRGANHLNPRTYTVSGRVRT